MKFDILGFFSKNLSNEIWYFRICSKICQMKFDILGFFSKNLSNEIWYFGIFFRRSVKRNLIFWNVFEKFVKKNQVILKSDNSNVTSHEDRYTFVIISSSLLLTMRNVSDKSCTENQNTNFVFGNFFFENRAVCVIMWGKYCRVGRTTVDSMAHAHCMLDTQSYKHTHSSCVRNSTPPPPKKGNKST